MKKFLIISVLFLYVVTSIHAQDDNGPQEINWHTVTEAVKLNQKEPKKMIIDVYTDWCGWCKVMDRTTFSDSTIIEYINNNYYAVKFNAEQKENITIGDKTYKFVDNGGRGYHELAAVLLQGKLGYPSTVFVNEKGEILELKQGYLKPRIFDTIIKFYGGDHHLTKTYANFMETYSSPVPEI